MVTNFDKDIQSIIAKLELSSACDTKLVSVGRKIFAKTIEDKQKVIGALKNEKIDYFSHPHNEQKIFKAVLTGLPAIDPNDIINSLQTKHRISTSKVIMPL